MPSTYDSLGVRPVINAFATLTKLGGSVMAEETVQAMQDAAACFIDLHELQEKVGERIAALTQNKAAYVSSGAAAGLFLATAACVAGSDPKHKEIFPNLEGFKNEVIMQKMHRNSYDYAVREVGVKLIEIGSEEKTEAIDLENAITDKTAAIFWFQGVMNKPSELALEDVIALAKKTNIPVIVDAAAQLPPVSNLWKFTQMGAALAIFSGGKDLAGPQSSGLVLGRKDLIDTIRMHGAPNHSVGRPLKVGKEEMLGLLAAVERYLKLDHNARAQVFEDRVKFWNESLAGIEGVSATRDYPNEAGQPAPRSLISFSNKISKDHVIEQLWQGNPRIAVAPSEKNNGILLNPMTIQEGEETIILNKLKELLAV